MKILILCLLILFFTQQSFAQSSHASVMVQNEKKEFLGSAVQVCGLYFGKSSYYVTASHVVENITDLRIVSGGASLKARVVYSDPSIDFAILDIEGTAEIFRLLVSPMCLEARLETELPFPVAASTYHLDQAARAKKYFIAIDGVNPETGHIVQKTLNSPIVHTRTQGVPGRDHMGSLIQFEGQLWPGASGSIVSVYTKFGTTEYYTGDTHPCGDKNILCEWRREIIGVLTVANPNQKIAAALSWNKILNTVRNSQRNNPGQRDENLPLSVVKISGGVQYNASKIVHLRNSPQDEVMAMTRAEPTSTGRTTDKATGRTTDKSMALNAGHWRSGIILPRFPERRWLNINKGIFDWTENEPFHEGAWLSQNSSEDAGIYEENGNIYHTQGAYWPVWIDMKLLNSGPVAESQSCAEMIANQWKGKASLQKPDQIRIKICQSQDSQQQDFSIAMGKDNRQIYRLHLGNQGVGLPISVTAIDETKTPLTREGLRTFKNDNFYIEIDFSSGFYIEIKRPNQSPLTIIGPVQR